VCIFHTNAGGRKSVQPPRSNDQKNGHSALVYIFRKRPYLRLQPTSRDMHPSRISSYTRVGERKMVRPRRNTPGLHWFMKMAGVYITFLSGGRLTFWQHIDFSRGHDPQTSDSDIIKLQGWDKPLRHSTALGGHSEITSSLNMHNMNLETSGDSISVNVRSLKVLWHVEPLLGNDRKISNYTTAVAKPHRDSLKQCLSSCGPWRSIRCSAVLHDM
jgi:hypothetical protein